MRPRFAIDGRPYFTLACGVIGLLIALSGLLPPASHAQSPNRVPVDRVVAVVGDDIILKSEVDQFVQQQTQQPEISYSPDLWMNALQELVNQQVVAEKARRDTTITVSDQQVSNQLDSRIQQMAQRAGGEEQLEQIYGESILEIKQTFRDDFRDQILTAQLQETRRQQIDITPSEVRQWFEQIPQDSLPRLPETVRLSHVVRYPKPTDESRRQAQQRLTSIRDSIVNGEASFEAMARQYSDHAGSAPSGGRMSDVNLDDLVPEFAAVASRTPVGEVSQAFYNENHNGYHIVRVNSQEGRTVDLNHILIRVETDEQQPIEYLNAVRDTLLNYEVPFELMAKRHSEENRSADNGGRVTDPQSGTRDLRLEALGASWQETIRNLDEGEISKPTQVQLLQSQDQAYHIVRLDRRTPAHRLNLETDYERIRQRALQEKQNRKIREWMNELRDEIYVDIRISKTDLTAMNNRP